MLKWRNLLGKYRALFLFSTLMDSNVPVHPDSSIQSMWETRHSLYGGGSADVSDGAETAAGYSALTDHFSSRSGEIELGLK